MGQIKNVNRLSRVHQRYRQTTDGRTDDDILRTWTWVHVR